MGLLSEECGRIKRMGPHSTLLPVFTTVFPLRLLSFTFLGLTGVSSFVSQTLRGLSLLLYFAKAKLWVFPPSRAPHARRTQRPRPPSPQQTSQRSGLPARGSCRAHAAPEAPAAGARRIGTTKRPLSLQPRYRSHKALPGACLRSARSTSGISHLETYNPKPYPGSRHLLSLLIRVLGETTRSVSSDGHLSRARSPVP